MNEHYYTRKPTSELKLYEIKATLRGFNISLITSSGVFSPKRVDKATRLLAENMKALPGWEFLDYGCGYGVIGIVAAKEGCGVTMTDVNERALWLAKKNIKKNNVNAVITTPENVKGLFNTVATNPPIAAGMKECFGIISRAKTLLRHDGLFQMVARHSKGGERLMLESKRVFGNVETIARKGGFRVYASRKTKTISGP